MLISLTSIYSPTITALLKAPDKKTAPRCESRGRQLCSLHLTVPIIASWPQARWKQRSRESHESHKCFGVKTSGIRIPTHSVTTSLTFGTLSSNEPWCIITSDNKASTASDNDSDSGRLTETNIRRAPSRSALRIQATACPAGNSPKDLRQCVNPRARPN